jgi:hypothetical protein
MGRGQNDAGHRAVGIDIPVVVAILPHLHVHNSDSAQGDNAMRKIAGLAAVALMLTQVSSLHAQTASSFLTGVSPSQFTPINPTQAMYTPSANSGAFNLIGFSPMSFFRSVGNFFQWPPNTGNSNAGTLVTGPNPFPTGIYQFPSPSAGMSNLTTADLPTMQLQTSFGH